MSTEGRPVIYLENTIYKNYSFDEALSQIVSSYDAFGNLLFKSTYFQANSDPFTTTTTYNTYDVRNNLIREIIKLDLTGDDVVDVIYDSTNTYNDQNLLIKIVYKNDNNADGDLDYIVTTEYHYNQDGRVVKRSDYQDLDGSGASIEATSITEYAYDGNGRLILETNVFESDADKDGDIDSASSRIAKYAYDKSGNIIKKFTQEDVNGDGQIDIETTRDVTYNKRGDILTFREFDTSQSDRTLSGYNQYDKKGNVTFTYMQRENEYWISQEFQYDKKCNLIKKITKQNDSDSQGDPLSIETVTYQYDKEGNRTRENVKNEFFGYEDPENYVSFSSTVYDYDGRDNLIYKGLDQDADGNVDIATFSIHDVQGNKLLELTQYDFNDDGEIDSQDLKNFTYNKENDLVREYNDFGNDGSIEYEYTRQELDNETFLAYNLPEDFPILV